eukprot:3727784-Alexandrium_andersonii.AAC.1
MPGGEPDVPLGLGDRARAKRSRSAGAAPAAGSSPLTAAPSGTTTPSSVPRALGPSGVAGSYWRSPGGQAQQPTPVDPESA